MEGSAAVKKEKIAIICGPTATGKSALAVRLAKEFRGEVISADSMQIYKGLDIGTAKVTEEEQESITHHLLDFLEPTEIFSVADYVQMAKAKITEITGREKLPIFAGGTGLYLSSLVNGVSFTDEKTDSDLRHKLQNQADLLGHDAMWEKLYTVDPEYAKTVHPNNEKRVLRALELFEKTGVTMSQQQKQSLPAEKPYHVCLIGLGYHDRDILYQRINKRIDLMMEKGILKEAEYVYRNRDSFVTAVQAIGYKEFFPYFEHTQSLKECVETLKRNSRRYAKRQMTWFERMPGIQWIWLDEECEFYERAAEYFRKFCFS